MTLNYPIAVIALITGHQVAPTPTKTPYVALTKIIFCMSCHFGAERDNNNYERKTKTRHWYAHTRSNKSQDGLSLLRYREYRQSRRI